MRLTEQEPRWITDTTGRHGMGMSFKSPRCPPDEEYRIAVAFDNPLDGGPPSKEFAIHWHRTGDTFENMTLTPSIELKLPAEQYWHGFLTNGELKSV